MPKVKSAGGGAPPAFKIPPRRLDSDDFEMEEDGEVFHPHAGEWIEVLPLRSLARWLDWQRLTDVEDREGFDRLADHLAAAITAWTWTDLAGRPLPQPFGHPDAFRLLDNREIAYLVGAVQRPRAVSKNSDSGSPDGR